MIRKRLKNLFFKSDRRNGTELEILAFDGCNRPPEGEKPQGSDYVVNLIKKHTDDSVEWRSYEHTNKNNVWVVKTDSSCGLEVCTPIYRNWRGIRKVCQVVDAFSKDENIKIDDRCSVHLHVEVADLTEEQIATVILYWIKCEAVFLDMVPQQRKMNKYCQAIHMRDLFDTDVYLKPFEIIDKVGECKYYTMNTYQYISSEGNRKTMEFRIIEGAGCKNPYLIKNWLRLILHFVEMASKLPFPERYSEGDPWSWACILDPKDVLKVLGFSNDPYQYNLSPGLTQTRNWMLARLCRYMNPDKRRKAYFELMEIMEKFRKDGINVDVEENLFPSVLQESLYNINLRF